MPPARNAVSYVIQLLSIQTSQGRSASRKESSLIGCTSTRLYCLLLALTKIKMSRSSAQASTQLDSQGRGQGGHPQIRLPP